MWASVFRRRPLRILTVNYFIHDGVLLCYFRNYLTIALLVGKVWSQIWAMLEMKTNISRRPATNLLVCFLQSGHFSPSCIFFSHDNVNDFCFYSQLRWDSLRTYRCVVANNSTNGSPYCCGRTSTEWAIFGSPSMETIATICWDVSKLICLPAPFVI